MDYQEQIRVYQRELSINRSIIDQEYWHIGNAARDHEGLADMLGSENLENYQALAEQVRGLEGQKERLSEDIKEIEARIAEIRRLEKSRSTLKEERRVLQAGLADTEDRVGEQAFQLYATAPQSFMEYSGCFTELDSLIREQYNLETRIQGFSRNPEGEALVKRLVNGTRSRLLSHQLKGIKEKMKAAYGRAARKMRENPELAGPRDARMASIIKPLDDLHLRLSELAEEILAMEEGMTQAKADISERWGNKKPEDHIMEKQLRISELDEELRRILTEAGKLLFEGLGKETPENLKDFFHNLKGLLDENTRKEEKIRRLEAAQKILALEDERKKLNSQKDRLDQQVQNLQAQLQRIEADISRLTGQISSLAQIRGDESQLSTEEAGKAKSTAKSGAKDS